MDTKALLKAHFEHFAKINGRKSEQKIWFDLKIFGLTGEAVKTPFGYYNVYYKLNKWNPLVYGVIFLGFFTSIFEYGLKEFFRELKKEWNLRERLEVKTSIYEEYMDK